MSSNESLGALTSKEKADGSFVDNELSRIIGNHLETLQNTEKTEFRQLDFGDKIDKLCWEWTENDDAEIYEKAVHLRSLAIAKGMIDFMHQDSDEPRSYEIPTLDYYWSKVDYDLQSIVTDLAEEHNGFVLHDSKPFDDVVGPLEFVKFAEIWDHLIERKSFSDHHVTYVVNPRRSGTVLLGVDDARQQTPYIDS